jgi:hypothetical protein
MPTIQNSRRLNGKKAAEKARTEEKKRLARLVKAQKTGPMIPDQILRELQELNLPKDKKAYTRHLNLLLKDAT